MKKYTNANDNTKKCLDKKNCIVLKRKRVTCACELSALPATPALPLPPTPVHPDTPGSSTHLVPYTPKPPTTPFLHTCPFVTFPHTWPTLTPPQPILRPLLHTLPHTHTHCTDLPHTYTHTLASFTYLAVPEDPACPQGRSHRGFCKLHKGTH